MKLKSFLFVFQNQRCYRCGGVMIIHNPPNAQRHLFATKDHVRPKHPKGGGEITPGGPGNTLLAHTGCNKHKRNRMPNPCEILCAQIAGEIYLIKADDAQKQRTARSFERRFGRLKNASLSPDFRPP